MRSHSLMALAGLLGAALIVASLKLPRPVPVQAALPAVTAEAAPEAPKAKGPNVVFILVDTLRSDRFAGARNGIPLMPKLNALAQQGRNFTNAISPSSHTRTTMASLITGQYVDTHGVYYGAVSASNGGQTAQVVPEGWVTLAESLGAAGYVAWAFVTNGNAHASAGYAQGYREGDYVYENAAIAERVTSAALEKIRGLDAPFYLYLHYIDPHAPYFPPDRYRDIFGPSPEVSDTDKVNLAEDRQIPYLLVHDDLLFGKKAADSFTPLSDAGKETMRIWYDAECRYIDDEVSRLIESLRASHPDTIFVFTSDHGEEFWEHGGMGHGFTLYQEQVHVPLFLIGPGIAPETVDAAAGNIGIYRTLVERIGVTTTATPKGDNLLGSAFDSLAYSRTKGPSTELAVDLQAVLYGNSKGIHDATAARTDVFDLSTDPGEHAAVGDPARVAEFDQLLEAHRAATAKARPARIQPATAPLNPEIREHQKQMGYGKLEE
jgi:arylsulfatase A-like enzyme